MQFEWLNDNSRIFLNGGYLSEGETGESRIRDIADAAENRLVSLYYNKNHFLDEYPADKKIQGYPDIIHNFSDIFYEYMSKGWFSLSSPIWANFGKERGFPVSCFNSVVGDSCDSILDTNSEIGKMTQMGGGTSLYMGKLRERGAKISKGGVSEGPMSFLPLFEATAKCLKQSSVRRGQLAVYLDVDHPDIMEFLEIRSDGHPIQDLNFGVCIPEGWMDTMIDGDSEKRKIWGKILKCRSSIGYPYIQFSENADKGRPQVYKDKDMPILSSNLCCEINLPSSEEESFVCVLSSLNIAKYDEWKGTNAPQILLMFLDAVNEEFISKSRGIKTMERARRFATRHRALGLGVLGWHSYLQAHSLPFGSMQAMSLTKTIFKEINEQTLLATQQMAEWFGEPELLEGYGQRNTTRMAIAPTKSSSFILGQTSQSIEPIHSNYFIDDKAKIEVVYKNPELMKIFESYGKNTKETWNSIKNNDGSVSHLDFLSDHEKEVFQKYSEISQMDIVTQAGIRQKEIDQGQSLNFLIHPDTPPKTISELHIEAFRQGVKGVYYQKSMNAANQLNLKLMECSACEG